MNLPSDSKVRKETPIFGGVMNYFPLALAAVARVSFEGNEKHNPGEPLHWSRGKSDDHLDCIARHLIDAGKPDEGGSHSAKLAWRALANLQIEEERRLDTGAQLANMVPAPDPQSYTENFPLTANYRLLVTMGCSEIVAGQIYGGTTFPSPTNNGPIVYLSGPMRGVTDSNFPAFDGVRDILLDKGYVVISPADIDRAAGEQGTGEVSQETYAYRDFFALLLVKKLSGSIMMLNGWEESRGALAEFGIARWLGIKIVYGGSNYLRNYGFQTMGEHDYDKNLLTDSICATLNEQEVG